MPFMMQNDCFQQHPHSSYQLKPFKNISLPNLWVVQKDDSHLQETFLFSFLKAFMVLVKGVAKYLEPTEFFLPNYGWQKYVGLIARDSAFG